MSKLNAAVAPLVDKPAATEFVDVVEIDVAAVNCFSIFFKYHSLNFTLKIRFIFLYSSLSLNSY